MLLMAKPWQTYYKPQSNNIHRGIFIFFVLFISTCVFAFWEYDTYHTWNEFIYVNKHPGSEIWMYEAIYNWLALICGNHYFVWRFVIWFPACLFLYFAAKRLNLLHRNFLLAMILFGSMTSYSRGFLGHAMLLYGVVLLVDRNSTIRAKIWGIIFFCLSYYFHKSMFVNIAFALLAFYPFGKNIFKLLLVLFPLFVIVVRILINDIVSGALNITLGDNVGGTGDRTLWYASGKQVESNMFGMVALCIDYIPEYMMLFYLINRIFFRKILEGIKYEREFLYLFRLSFVTMYIASLFAFVDTSSWIYLRFKNMAFFPLPFVLAKVWSLEKKSTIWIRWIILLQIFALFFEWSYRLYKWYNL